MDRCFSIDGAAAYLAVSPFMVKKLLKTGQLGKSKVGRRTVIRESQLQRVIKDQFPIDHSS
ncbi:MAG: helix-turn-helix domain-containing protein [Terriglobales bacterium]